MTQKIQRLMAFAVNRALTAQTKELGAPAQKVATEASEPIKSGVSKAFSKS